MAIKYKVNIIEALKENGYSSYRIRQERIFGQSNLQQLRNGELVSWATFNTICKLLKCQPGDILEYVDDSKKTEEN
ncbi:MAG: helix-turn-helix transcriptional regulator [Clostridiaceae bacterium]|nr:helix-turn-helix transcriptional regulator [Clostridiaceae bacterium]